MSFEDAPTNTEHAELLREVVKHAQAEQPTQRRNAELYIYGGPAGTPWLSAEVLLAAANALEALGVKGYAAARLQMVRESENPLVADVVLEAADTADDTLAEHRRILGDARVEAELDELREQL